VADNLDRAKEARKTLATATKDFKANRGDPVPQHSALCLPRPPMKWIFF